MKKAHSKKLSIPCFFEEPKAKVPSNATKKVVNKYKTSKNSPNSSILSKVKKITSCVKTTSRQPSPRVFMSCNCSPPRSVKTKNSNQVVKKKKVSAKKSTKTDEKLFILTGENLKYAPKIYDNQLFVDVYDEFGRHDRLMEIQESITSDRDVAPVIIFTTGLMNNVELEGPRPPGNSFEETCQDSDSLPKVPAKLDLFAKLEKIAKAQKDLDD